MLSRHTALPPDEIELTTGMGILKTLKPLPVLSRTPLYYDIVLRPQGSCFPTFTGEEENLDVHKIQSSTKEKIIGLIDEATKKKTHSLRNIAHQFSSRANM